MKRKNVLIVATLGAAVATGVHFLAYGQGHKKRPHVLDKYLREKTVTELEWNLLQFNLLWHDSYQVRTDYFSSNPVSFDKKTMKFTARFRVANKRSFDDPQPFFTMKKFEQEATMRQAATYLERLLANYFPEVKTNKQLLEAEFIYQESGGGRSTVGTFREGTLRLMTQ